MRIISVFLLFCSIHCAIGQSSLENPSFEDTPSDAMVPHGWFMCNDSTTPDILPGFWGVNLRPNDGSTFVGLISRTDGSYEYIGQRLQPALEAKECYSLSLAMAHSKSYAGYNKSIRIRIWLGSEKCKKEQLIFESEKISNSRWKNLQFDFTPIQKMKYFSIEAYSPKAERGNILIDNISSIRLCERV